MFLDHLVLTALHQALVTHGPLPGLVHHSDRGHTDTYGDYQARLAAEGITVSMSRRGDCWDNAVVESGFATLKRDLVSQERWATRAEAQAAVAEYLQWYNLQRRHSALGHLSRLRSRRATSVASPNLGVHETGASPSSRRAITLVV